MLLAGAPLMVIAALALWQAYLGERERAAQLLRDQARAMAMQVDSEFARADAVMHTLLASRALARRELAAFRVEARSAAAALDQASVALLDDAGRVTLTTGGDNAATATGLPPAARRALATGSVEWSDYDTDAGGERIELYGALPASGPARLLRLRLADDALRRVLLGQRFAGGRAASIIDRNGLRMARSQAPEMVGVPASAAVLRALETSDDGVFDRLSSPDGVVSVVAFARASRSGYAVIVRVPESAFVAPLWFALSRTVAVAAVLLAVALLAAYAIGRSLADALERVARGSAAGPTATGLRETDLLAEILADASRQRARADQARDDVLATLSHDLRTPLSAIAGWAAVLMRDRAFTPAQRKALEAIDRNARAQAALVDDLLDATRIEAGRLVLSRAPVHVPEVVEAAAQALLPAAAAADIKLEIEAAAAVPPIHGDAARLQQVLWNLLGNAIKFSSRGGRVYVRVTPAAQGGVRIEVRDTGRGIDPAFLPHVFDRFRQEQPVAAGAVRGLGLGLWIAKSIVDQHGGRVWAESEGPGRGARFVVELPASGQGAVATSTLKPATLGVV